MAKTAATRRRARGEGGLSFDATNGVWTFTLDMGRDADGKRIRRKVSAKGQAECVRKAEALKREVGLGIDQDARSMTVGTLLDIWQAEKGKSLAPAMRRTYRQMVDTYLAPLATVKVRDLTALRFDALLRAEAERGMSRSTLQRVKSTLSQAYDLAVLRGIAERNVIASVGIPAEAATRRKRQRLSETEFAAIIRQCDATSGTEARYAAMLATQLFTACRPGEVEALRWQDVDFDACHIRIAGAMHLNEDGCSAKRTDAVKRSTSGYRTVTVPPEQMARLRRHQTAQKAAQLHSGARWANPDDLVFTTYTGNHLTHRDVSRAYGKIAERAGVRGFHPYMCRHSLASILSDRGAPLTMIAAQLGDDPDTVAKHYLRPDTAPVNMTAYMAGLA